TLNGTILLYEYGCAPFVTDKNPSSFTFNQVIPNDDWPYYPPSVMSSEKLSCLIDPNFLHNVVVKNNTVTLPASSVTTTSRGMQFSDGIVYWRNYEIPNATHVAEKNILIENNTIHSGAIRIAIWENCNEFEVVNNTAAHFEFSYPGCAPYDFNVRGNQRL
ncbi:MAG: hypothetical protein HYS98_01725, partial [Deltaproteobacteria bacterium]|nr:hypothetical protein [Deltaproteobacteria bacterium]